jgi:hypothetical protein
MRSEVYYTFDKKKGVVMAKVKEVSDDVRESKLSEACQLLRRMPPPPDCVRTQLGCFVNFLGERVAELPPRLWVALPPLENVVACARRRMHV